MLQELEAELKNHDEKTDGNDSNLMEENQELLKTKNQLLDEVVLILNLPTNFNILTYIIYFTNIKNSNTTIFI